MTAQELFQEASRRGLRLKTVGDKLAVIPANLCPPDFAATLKAHKSELLVWLNRPPCPGSGEVPPDGLPLIPVEPRPTPATRQLVIDYLLRQGADHPGPLTAWLVRRESDYYDGPGKHWDCAAFAYAAARDAACWQLNRGEREALDLLVAALPKPVRQ
ncbi:MAG: hypothetical protein EB141_18590 [Verrucomicrobia bacterium]|nr:hypothetical protein [Verrucomicrobiota bacterium]NBU09175.1 hypothetical protein [Pseudomonadota bacterium]NDA68344.1 hypothetical protein [Verrucomicrobiota bacterium]NDB77621.1 hypothetical protein [Verrucomicrobiota bacterium]NDD39360.1 hypothetical protein [Verrucomicrobiota bacterium]